MIKDKKLRLQALLLVLMLGFLCFRVVPPAVAHAAPIIELNTFYTVTLAPGETKEFSIYISYERYFVVETRGNADTYLTVEGLSVGTLADDDSGVGQNACIGFVSEIGKLPTIKIRLYNPNASGTVTLQVRQQQAVEAFCVNLNDNSPVDYAKICQIEAE